MKLSQCCIEQDFSQSIHGLKLLNRAQANPGKPGKSWNFIVVFSRTGIAKVLERAAGPGKFWKSVKLQKKKN